MQPGEIAQSTGPTGELVLRRRPRDPSADRVGDAEGDSGGDVIELRANGVFVMDTAETTSEIAMATASLAASRLRGGTPRRVLVGGLGLGFTLGEVLRDPFVEEVTVVEIEPALVGWMRDGTIPHGPALLADDRVTMVVEDVAVALRDAADASYDLVLLDVDNGPGYLVHDGNAALYETPLLGVVREKLAEGGTLVIWSAFEEPELPLDMHDVFGNCRAVPVPVDLQGRDEAYWLYASTR
jgi:spermidine synthase